MEEKNERVSWEYFEEALTDAWVEGRISKLTATLIMADSKTGYARDFLLDGLGIPHLDPKHRLIKKTAKRLARRHAALGRR